MKDTLKLTSHATSDGVERGKGSAKVKLKGVEAFKDITNTLAVQQRPAGRISGGLPVVAVSAGKAKEVEAPHITMRRNTIKYSDGVPFRLPSAPSLSTLGAPSVTVAPVVRQGATQQKSPVVPAKEPETIAVGLFASIANSQLEGAVGKSRSGIRRRKVPPKSAKQVLVNFVHKEARQQQQAKAAATAGTAPLHSREQPSAATSYAGDNVPFLGGGGSTVSAKKITGSTQGANAEYWEVEIESLGGGIASLLGSAVGGVVRAGKSVGGKKQVPRAEKANIPTQVVAQTTTGQRAKKLVTGTVVGGVGSVFSGVGQIARGSVNIMVGTLGCFGGALVCMSRTIVGKPHPDRKI